MIAPPDWLTLSSQQGHPYSASLVAYTQGRWPFDSLLDSISVYKLRSISDAARMLGTEDGSGDKLEPNSQFQQRPAYMATSISQERSASYFDASLIFRRGDDYYLIRYRAHGSPPPDSVPTEIREYLSSFRTSNETRNDATAANSSTKFDDRTHPTAAKSVRNPFDGKDMRP